MAGLHLRAGSLSLARAELEAFAGLGVLDEQALVDLAEARWRTGDLAGAGEAADALLASGRNDPLALLVAAEAVFAAGRPAEARRLAGRALAAIDGPLEPVFAGMPRSLIWPSDGEAASSPSDHHAHEKPSLTAHDVPEQPVSVPDGGEPIAARVAAGPSDLARPHLPAPAPGPASTAAASAYAGGRGALEAGDTVVAAIHLAVALRLDPGFASGVLDAVGDEPADPSLALVAGDALRLLGRETEALAAFDRARGVTTGPPLVEHEVEREDQGEGEDAVGLRDPESGGDAFPSGVSALDADRLRDADTRD